jgi:hypothetical protein
MESHCFFADLCQNVEADGDRPVAFTMDPFSNGEAASRKRLCFVETSLRQQNFGQDLQTVRQFGMVAAEHGLADA